MRSLVRWGLLFLVVLTVNGCESDGSKTIIPEVPQLHLQATTIPQENIIRIEWNTDGESNPSRYGIYRSISPEAETFQSIAIVSYNDNYYEDGDVIPGVKYYYRISIFDDAGNESNLSDMAGYTLLEKPVLISPADQAALGTAAPIFTWLDVSGASAYTVHVHSRSADGGVWEEIWESDKVYPYQPLRREYNEDNLAVKPLESGMSYKWRVDASGGRSTGSQSRWWHFTVVSNQ